jgi:hypothetical protein
MANTTFNGPVRSENGFQTILSSPTTGNITVTSTIGPATSVDTLAADSVTVANFVGMTAILTAALPAAAAGNAGQVRLISDNGAGNDEYCLVISTGAAWVTAVGAALS